ncbi:hypothetical protein EDC96DRAFT_542836 [Choanephora cucurbitarum]|nr:hypothetical protein EDC96DRAFT_542836 [Choanephora cucurbitarum]
MKTFGIIFATACLSLFQGTLGSVISKRQVGAPTPPTPPTPPGITIPNIFPIPNWFIPPTPPTPPTPPGSSAPTPPTPPTPGVISWPGWPGWPGWSNWVMVPA